MYPDGRQKISLYDEKGNRVGKAYLNTRTQDGVTCLIIESDNKTNPVEYTQSLWEVLQPILRACDNNVYVDLSDLYGLNNSSWLYKLNFCVDRGQLIEVKIDRVVQWSDIANKSICRLLQDYLFEKLSYQLYGQL